LRSSTTVPIHQWRSPEEYYDWKLNEKVDVYAVANNMYSVLTGLWVFYDEHDDDKVKRRIKNGETAYIDPRYKEGLAEAKIAEIIERCHAFKPDDRPSIFEVVDFLRKALTEVLTEKDSNK
jgi:serine/threonine protein kinase